MRVSRRSQSRSVTFLYGGIAGVLLMVIATVALIVAPPSPPSVAEFAPRAEDAVDEAPDSLSSRFGVGPDGYCPPGAVCDPDDPAVTQVLREADSRVIERARVRRCVGDPPRQTEDPQSPPCVNYWEGDNGGATTGGVTRDEIRVALPWDVTHVEAREPQANLLAEHFNRRYEFYGRRLRLTFVEWDLEHRNDPATQRATAATVHEEVRAFAALAMGRQEGLSAYYQELARRRIIGLQAEGSFLTSELFRRNRPFMWSYAPSVDQLQENLGDLACGLVGRSPYPGTSGLSTTRKFGIIYPKRPEGSPYMEPLLTKLSRCRAGEVLVREYQDSDTGSTEGQATLADLNASGATTVVCLCGQSAFLSAMRDSSQIGYRPEWLLAGFAQQEDLPGYHALSTPEQRNRVLGVGARNKVQPLSNRPHYWALKESDPSFNPQRVVRQDLYRDYVQLLVLASGIQMAGPNLTPDTLEQGLKRARFPNPGAGAEPWWQARVGFGPDDYTMIDDVAAIWWDESADAYGEGFNPRGGFCYIAQGSRWSPGRWPGEPLPFFDRSQPCR